MAEEIYAVENIIVPSCTFSLEDIEDSDLRDFFRKVLQEAYQQSLSDYTPIDVQEGFGALDQYRGPPNCRPNGILNWDDYQRIISTDGSRRGANVSFSTFARAVLFLELRRQPPGRLSPNYACNFSANDWLRRPQIYPDKAFIVAYDSTLAKYPPRFQIHFFAKGNRDQHGLALLNIKSTVDMVLLGNETVRLEMFNDHLDRMAGKVARSAELNMKEIQKRDGKAALFLTETARAIAVGSGFSNFYRTFRVSDELLGYIWWFARGEGASAYQACSSDPSELESIFVDVYPRAFTYEPLKWIYHIFAIPSDVPVDDLPQRIIGHYNSDPLKAIKSLRTILIDDVFAVLSRDYLEEEVEMILQSSFIAPFNEQTAQDQLLSMLVKADVLLSVQKDPRLVCYVYQLPRRLRNIMLLYIFNDDQAADLSSVALYRESICRRMNEALEFAARLVSRLNGEAQPKSLLIEIVNQVREWFPHINLHPKMMDKLWSMVGEPHKDDKNKYSAFYGGVVFFFEVLHHGLVTGRALEIIRGLSSQAKMTLREDEDGGARLANLVEKLNKGGFLTAITLPREDIKRILGSEANGFWRVIERKALGSLPDSLLVNRKFYLCSDLGIKDGYHTPLHELLHGVHDYGSALNHLGYHDYKLEGVVKREKLPNWLNEALAEYFAQREMRRRGLDPGVNNFCRCKSGVFAIRSLIRAYGEPLEEALLGAHLSGDYTRVRDILNQRGLKIFSGLMSEYDKDGVEALKWVQDLDINIFYDDWR